MKKKEIISVLLLLLAVSLVHMNADDNKAKIQELMVPRTLATGAGGSMMQPPQTSLINPASSALAQRTTFDGSYIALFGSGNKDDGWKGHFINFGQTIPTKVGVFTWNSGFLTSSFDAFDTGSQFSLSGSFAKDIYPDTFIGLGLKTVIADGPQYTAAADVGLIRTRSSLFFLDDVKWSLALQNLGYSDIEKDRSPLYSVTVGLDGEFFKSEKAAARLLGDISWVEFDNLRASAGMQLTLGNYFNISIGSRLDMKDLLDGESGELVPSVGLSYTYIPGNSEEESLSRNELQPYITAAPVTSSIWAVGAGLTVPIGRIDKEAPEINLDLSDVIKKYRPENTSAENEEKEQDDTVSHIERGYRLKQKYSYLPFKLTADTDGTEGKEVMEKQTEEEDYQKGRLKTTIAEFNEKELDNEVPEADIYLSPNNDGIQDDLSFPLSISEKRYIKGYEFIVENEEGDTVRIIENKETRPEKRTVKTFFQNLFSSKSGIQVPEQIRWDGLTDSGEIASDGLYSFYIRAWDDNENYGTSEKYTLFLDTQPPVVEVEKDDEQERIFSPNDDGNKDVLPIMQQGTREDVWKAVIEDSTGKEVKRLEWNMSRPSGFEWDGTNNEGFLVPDGVYQYTISSTDRAGNSGKAEYMNLVKNTEETPISLTIDHSHFSPNGDGVLDVVLLESKIPVVRGIESWKLDIKSRSGTSRRSYTGTAQPAGTIAFDGKDESGNILPEGQYFASLDVLYVNGNNPSVESAPFVIDITPPRATTRLDNEIFSPNGDGNKDVVNINQETSLEENWYGTITDIDEKVIYQFKWIERADSTITWDGRSSDGSLAEDGYYFYQLSTVDRAGNPGQSSKSRFELNTEETEVLLTTNYDYFSPNGDGSKDTILLLPRLKGSQRVKEYELVISGSDRGEVYRRSGTGEVPESFAWDGFALSGEKSADGNYTALLKVTNMNGNQNTALSQPFIIDTLEPQVELEAEYSIFSPEGDGRKDTVQFSVRNSSSEELWEGQILDQNDIIIKSSAWQGRPDNYTWDGTDSEGNTVQDGNYRYKLFASDKAGNYTEKISAPVQLDTSITKLFVTVDSDKLSPNGDGTYEQISFSTIVTRRIGLESWSLELVDASGKVQKRFEGEMEIPKIIVWNGQNERGEFFESEYRARFTAQYRKGNMPSVESLPFTLDVTAPRTEVSITPVPFSPDNDGADDELSIQLKVTEKNDIDGWSFTIFDAERSGMGTRVSPKFKVFSGSGQPASELIWDGRSNNGELVYAAMDYPYRFEVVDSFGNISVEAGKIPIDVLVIREDGLLKIKIANINFKPNTAEYVDDNQEIRERNEYVLDRLAEILKKYRQYKITIQGHANVTKFWDPALAAAEQEEELLPLSEERAFTVMSSLIERNIGKDRLSAEGVGGRQPLVPFDDAENRWKNRRVEFILEKE